MHEFRLPDIGEGISEAELLEWLVNIGDEVSEGDDIAMISTDKVNVDIPSPRNGIVASLPWEPGDIISVGDVFMVIDDGSDATSSNDNPPPDTDSAADRPASESSTPARKVKAGPAVRRYAHDKGVDIAAVTPSGKGGQVTRGDIDAFLAGTDQVENADGPARMKLVAARLFTARRLAESAHTLATTTTSFEVPAKALREVSNELSKEGEQRSIKVTPLAVIAKCTAHALADHPNFNATIDEDDNALLVHRSVNLGIAVDTRDAGLMVPVVRDIDRKDIFSIASDIAKISAKARSGQASVEDMQGSSFTVSSTGGLEKAAILGTTPVVNIPNVATLWVSRIMRRPVVAEDEIIVGELMYGTLAYDHRYLHGADGIAFINRLVEVLAEPSQAL